MEFEEIKKEIMKDFKKKSIIKRIQNNLDYLKESSEKSDFERFYFINEPSLDYWNITGISLNNEQKHEILKWAYENTKDIFNY